MESAQSANHPGSNGVNPTPVKDLEDGDLQKLRNAADDYTLEGDLRRQRAWHSSACRTSAARVVAATA